jgi:hypothetical protein
MSESAGDTHSPQMVGKPRVHVMNMIQDMYINA